MISDRDVLEDIKSRASIVDIISRYVSNIKKSGRNYQALCPFHNEKTPSFTISEEKQIFHCFGCGKGGDVFKFVSEIENISFPESIKRVADLINYQLPDRIQDSKAKTSHKQQKRDHFLEIMQKAVHVFQHNMAKALSQGKNSLAINYLLGRGLKAKEIETLFRVYKIGFAQDSWEQLKNSLSAYKADDLIELGLLSKNDNGKIFDKFRKRIIFPIYDEYGRAIAFGGRSLQSEQQPKYLNSPENLLFKKGKELYGLNFAKESIRQNRRVFVMEGYLDVLMAYLRDVPNAVAPLGTALSEDHLRILKRFSEEILLVFDGDKAGTAAVLRVAEIGRNLDLDIRVMELPPGSDPFDYFLSNDSVDFFMKAENARTLQEFELRYLIRQEGEKTGLRKAVEALFRTHNRIEREKGVRLVSGLLGISSLAVQEELERLGSTARHVPRADEVRQKEPVNSKNNILTRKQGAAENGLSRISHELIKVILLFPDTLDWFLLDFPDFPLNNIRDEADRSIFSRLLELNIEGKQISLSNLDKLNLADNLTTRIRSELMLEDYDQDEETAKSSYEKLKLQLREKITMEKIGSIKHMIDLARDKRDGFLEKNYMLEYQELCRQIDNLRDKIANFK